ncbi:MAG: hypothetical protein ACLP2X_25210, partial [Syntrophobacteraceae bacterium]
FKRIWFKIPKKFLATLFCIILSIFLKHGFDVYFSGAKLLSWPKLIPIIELVCPLLFLYFIGFFIYRSLQLISSKSELKIVLPYSHVSIGKYTTVDDHITVDIQAKIMLNDKVQPDIQNFLNRLALGDPYCHSCNRPIDMKPFNPIRLPGYNFHQCSPCNWRRNGTWFDLRNDVYAKIRSDYGHYWEVYQAKIREMTGGKPDAYTLPA